MWKSAKVGVSGLLVFAIGLTWELVYEATHPIKQNPGWYFVPEPYRPAHVVSGIGIVVVILSALAALVESAIRLARRKM
jgi:hypothetical protein